MADPHPWFHLRRSISVAIIGNAVRHKGIKTLIECLELVNHFIKFHIFGATDELDEFLDSAEISPHDSPIKTYVYGYDRSTLIDALRHMDVSLFLSTWPEISYFTRRQCI